MWTYNHSDELMHHGVKGMKWGVRKSRSSKSSGRNKLSKKIKKSIDTRKKKKAKERAEEEARAKAKAAQKKSVKDMSDAELRERIARLELEKRYRDLSVSQQTTGKGSKFVKNVLERSGEELATQVTKYYGAKMINAMIGDEAVYANNKKK